ncbi:MAG: SUMF1/EgtB/PvdO family nonheme iron enzyme, partial [Candidatus Brocadiae bacterium]|nr:SUMF1/EgtB/PvdO family nonheme iron enzyme [Candidatus Brocadiia bacterium]
AVAALGLAAPFVMKGRQRAAGEVRVAGLTVDPVLAGVTGAEAAAGQVLLQTVPEGAEVFVDGRSCGLSPASVNGLAAGRHVATFRLRDHAELTGEFSVGPGESISPVWRLENLIGGLALTVTPSGARVYVNGRDFGTASPVLDLRNLPAGRHTIRVESPDCRTWEADIEIAGGRVAERRVELAKIGFGTMVLESDPPGARVFVEGKDAGAAGKPLTVERLREGRYRVTFVLEGYEPLEAEIDVTADDVTTHTAALVARSSSLDLTVPAGAPVFVNGEPRAAGSQRFMNLRAGTHRIRVCDVEKTVTVEPGKSRELTFTMAELGMVRIPAGEFVMGSTEGYPDAVPARRVRLAGYAIDRTEVTVRQYRRFLEDVEAHGDGAWRHPDQPAGKSHLPPAWGAEGTMTEEFPVLGVDWFDAYAYAKWAGKRLPTEAEWERAARGASGQVWPWGGEAPYAGASVRANLGDRNGGTGGPRVVGSYPQGASAEGVLDMAGNAWEWCADWYANDAYLGGPAEDPRGPSSGRARVVRGGSFGMHPYLVRSFDRAAGDAVGDPRSTVGFRCAADLK